MAKSFHFTKKVQKLDNKINSCLDEIANLFTGIENPNEHLIVVNTGKLHTEELCEMLQKLDSILSSTPNVAEFILPHLGEFRKQNTINLLEDLSLNLKNCNNGPLSVTENLTTKINLHWKKICYNLENYLVELLHENYIPLQPGYNHLNLHLLKNFVCRLQDMYIPNLVWEKYQRFRSSYLKNYKCMCSFEESCLGCCLNLTIQCIYEDELLIFIGCFHPCTVTQSKVLEIYFEYIDRKFFNTLKILDNCFTLRKNLPKEILSILRLEKPSQVKNCFHCFMQSQIESEVESAIYCIQNNYGIESVWNVVFIASVLKLIKIISGFEDQINVLFYKREPTYHAHSNYLLTLIEDSKLVLATESPQDSPIFKSLNPISSKKQICLIENDRIHLIWSWRLALVENRSIIRLQRSLQNDSESIVKKFIDIEKRKLKSGYWKELLPSIEETYFSSETDHTNSLLQSVFCTVQNLEKFLPVLSTRCDSFQSFKSSFQHTLETYVINLIRHLKEIAACSNSHFVIHYEYIAFNNAIFLKNRICYYCDILKFSKFQTQENNILHSITQLTNHLMDSIYLHHYRYISCGIFFDAECNKFDDPKPFFEGERISYSIQMWNMHLQGLQHDLYYFLPQKTAKDLYVKILSSSLEHFLKRYSHATLSEARTPQVRYDLNCLLLCTSELLWPACSSVCQFIGRKHEMNEDTQASDINNIHSSCCFLLAVLVVLTAPLSELYEAFKEGFPQAQLSIRTKYESVAPWLPWIRRELFSEFCHRQIMSNVSVWLAVKASISWCLPNPMIVIKAFTEHNCTLSILLMMQAVNSSNLKSSNPDKSLEMDRIKLAYSLFELLICYGSHSHLQDILLPVIEKTNGWQEFNVGTTASLEKSWWYTGLLKTMKQFYVGICEEMIPVWYEVSKKCSDVTALKIFADIKSSVTNHLVCVCEKEPLNTCQDEFNISDEVRSYVCLKKFLESMQRNIFSLPQTFKCFLVSLNLHITNYVPEIQLIHQSIFLQILLSSAIDFLRDPEFENIIPTELKEITVLTASALETLLLKSEFFFISDNYTRNLKMLLSTLHESFNEFKNYIEKHSKSMHSKEIKDETLEITVHKLLNLPNGQDIIMYLHRLLCQNESWIQKSLGVPGMLSKDIVIDPQSPSPLLANYPELERGDSKEKELFTEFRNQNLQSQDYIESFHVRENKEVIGSSHQQTDGNYFPNFSVSEYQNLIGTLNLQVIEDSLPKKFNFNPIKCFDQLGENSFTQFVADKPSFQWKSIISHLPILGLTEVNFCTILSHRWDIRNEGPLTEEEQKCVEHLKIVYQVT